MRYFLITFFRKANGQIDEMVKVSKKIRPADLTSCNVIIDYASKNVEKCVVEGKQLDTNFDNLNSYYRQVYPALIAQLEKEAPIQAKTKE